jgi:hypothetical protein
MANGLSHHNQGQRPWNANRNQTFGQRPYSMHHAPGGLIMAVGQKCVLRFVTRGVAPGYHEHGLWPKMQICQKCKYDAYKSIRRKQTTAMKTNHCDENKRGRQNETHGLWPKMRM